MWTQWFVSLILVAVTTGCTSKPSAVPCRDNEGPQVFACDDVFAPRSIEVGRGGEVQWKNMGKNPHTVTIQELASNTPGAWRANSGNLDPGQEFGHAFDQIGTFDVFCRYHSGGDSAKFDGMAMQVIVR